LGFAFSPIVLTYLLFNTVVGIYNIAYWSSFSILKVRSVSKQTGFPESPDDTWEEQRIN
jgi:hypothetical protein